MLPLNRAALARSIRAASPKALVLSAAMAVVLNGHRTVSGSQGQRCEPISSTDREEFAARHLQDLFVGLFGGAEVAGALQVSPAQSHASAAVGPVKSAANSSSFPAIAVRVLMRVSSLGSSSPQSP